MSLTTLTMTLAGTLPKYDGIYFEVICHSTIVYQVNLACLRDGVAVLGLTGGGGGIMEQFFSQSLITYLWCGVWCLYIQHQCTFYI